MEAISQILVHITKSRKSQIICGNIDRTIKNKVRMVKLKILKQYLSCFIVEGPKSGTQIMTRKTENKVVFRDEEDIA